MLRGGELLRGAGGPQNVMEIRVNCGGGVVWRRHLHRADARYDENVMRRAASALEHHRAKRDKISHRCKPVGNQHRESKEVRRNHNFAEAPGPT